MARDRACGAATAAGRGFQAPRRAIIICENPPLTDDSAHCQEMFQYRTMTQSMFTLVSSILGNSGFQVSQPRRCNVRR